jgi:CBS-domain-containing membrane protein
MKIRDCMKRSVVSIPATATVGEAAKVFVVRHIGLLPVVDDQGRLTGILSLRDLLALALPSFIDLIADVDFVHDFGAVEAAQPAPETLARPITTIMRAATTVPEDCGLLRAYVLMRQRDLHDIPVVDAKGMLVGIASRVDVATAFLAGWQAEEVRKP